MYAVMEQDNWEDYDRKKTKTRINVQFNTLARKEWNIIASIHKLYVFVFWFSFIYCLDFCLSVSHCKCLDSLRTGPAVMCPTDFTFTELQRIFFDFAENVCQNIKTCSQLGGGANLLDSFSFSHAGIWIGSVFPQWILHGLLVPVCCLDQACWKNSF